MDGEEDGSVTMVDRSYRCVLLLLCRRVREVYFGEGQVLEGD